MAGTRGIGSWCGRWLRRGLIALAVLTVLPVLCLRWIAPPTTSVMVQHRFARMVGGELWPRLRYRWSDWDRIAPVMRLAAVAAEDQKFPRHWGFDFDAIADAVDEASARGRLRGASTISQQVARNLFLWQGRSWVRKGLEAYFTVLLEACWPKRRILEVYLNVAEFGDGVYGVAAASQAYFGKRPGSLSSSEAALLAAALPNPRRLHVRNPSAYVRERASWIEEQMALLGPAYLRQL
ncbi:MAG TPA: monofunctional biosynthetic peptidoglycan transglycosylase [Candidatus Sulfotelmatobacter sp.]|nr:monofunctional biosynthetic peptidoglycan transglycosylase [Candidatus Sulfotelmatobacter sp.]